MSTHKLVLSVEGKYKKTVGCLMAERYWVTGVQIGIMIAFLQRGDTKEAADILKEILEKQFIGRMPQPYEK